MSNVWQKNHHITIVILQWEIRDYSYDSSRIHVFLRLPALALDNRTDPSSLFYNILYFPSLIEERKCISLPNSPAKRVSPAKRRQIFIIQATRNSDLIPRGKSKRFLRREENGKFFVCFLQVNLCWRWLLSSFFLVNQHVFLLIFLREMSAAKMTWRFAVIQPYHQFSLKPAPMRSTLR